VQAGLVVYVGARLFGFDVSAPRGTRRHPSRL
jgi:hypothetical protein